VRIDIESLPTGIEIPSATARVEARVFAGMACGCHPVARQLDGREVTRAERLARIAPGHTDRCACEIGDGFTDREARRGSRVEKRDRGTLADRHHLARVRIEPRRGQRAVGDGNLEATDHRIARDETADRSIADRDEE
jgi:hypothetical protein